MKRLIAQITFFFAQNPLIMNFFSGEIHRGESKRICTPGLNCYSCPAAITSCPIGAAQLFFAGAKHNISLYVAGFLLTVSMIFGRFICGWICPMGLLQDLIYKIKTPKLRLKLRFVRYVKYVVLVLFVIALPMLVLHGLSGLGSPWFCKYICPSGTVFGAAPLLAANEFLRGLAGALLVWKTALAAGLLLTSVFLFRVFCRVLCPLGAFYALFNKIAFIKIRCDADKCVSCGSCSAACKILIEPAKTPNSPECVRCGDCRKACKEKALRRG
jgi:polyferredoxin